MSKYSNHSVAPIIAEIGSNPEIARAAVESVFDELDEYVKTAVGAPPMAEDLFMACLYSMLLASLAPGRPQPPAKFLELVQRIDGPRGTDFIKLLPDIRALRAWCADPIRKYFEARAKCDSPDTQLMDDSDIPF